MFFDEAGILLGRGTFLLGVLDPEHAAARTAFRRGMFRMTFAVIGKR